MILLASILVSISVSGQTVFVGPRMTAMGGAYTAVSNDGAALWTNPAGLAADPRIDFEIFGAALADDSAGFADALESLSHVDLAQLSQGDFSKLPGILKSFEALGRSGSGVLGSGAFGAMYGRDGWALGAGDVAFAGVYPVLDRVHVEPTIDPATGIGFNTSRAVLIGLEAREARFGYGGGFFVPGLYVGGVLRVIRGRTYFASRSLFGDNRSLDQLARDAFDKNATDTTRVAVDVGVLWKIGPAIRLGAVATSINRPTFRVASDAGGASVQGPSEVRLPRTVRVGAAVSPPLLGLTVSGDVDLARADTLVPGLESRRLSFGLEKTVALVAVRAGAFRDLAAPDPRWVYTAGASVGTSLLSANFAGVYSPGKRDLGAAVDVRVRIGGL